MPELCIILVSQRRERTYVEEALKIGVAGYVDKQAAATELGNAIPAVMSGGQFLSPLIAA
jgi:two-component system, NarL family, invasion response regulator UvrY